MSVKFERVLLPTRFSTLSRRAAEYVRLLASRFDCEIHVVHVVTQTDLVVEAGIPGSPIPVFGPPVAELLDEARRNLVGFVADALPGVLIPPVTHAAVGGVTDELIRYTRDRAIDLVVMGTHADGMVKRIVFGSVGKGVLEGASCPVMLVPVHDTPRP